MPMHHDSLRAYWTLDIPSYLFLCLHSVFKARETAHHDARDIHLEES